ncbi:Crp/Fnr family transcriptional regulator [Leptolyngbya sp. FACHB-261]|uniref:Crp/Fnr family transcriptional regulator n=1 Tax=Leptolyngbya sp. FACHB-261 TaxID=2692806 RepID=UPI001689A1DE|nr:Crp/Fnr family transcriptional regulator [Leptolyngbya sp. FACHB-261]MBD2100693.1 Crp/Fnr family transcriptional regulator [Leptolyngbya sp. FACHB-261]
MTARTIPLAFPVKFTDFRLDFTRRSFVRRASVPLLQDYLWRIESGIIRTFTWNEEGEVLTLGLWGPGDVVGRPLSKANPYEIECLTAVELSILPSHSWYQVLPTLLAQIQQSEELLSIIRCRPVEASLMQFLVWLSSKFGREVENGKLIDLPLTHQEIADLIGSTRVTVTRLLNQMEQEGTIHRALRRITILNVARA